MNKIKAKLFLITLMIFVLGCTANGHSDDAKAEVTSLNISAAISLTDALEEIKDIYEKENDVELSFNLAGSGTLAQQIQQGAPVDVFISANQNWMDTLEADNLIQIDTRSNITGNRLVLIGSDASGLTKASVEDVLKENITKIAIGNPESVPAGKYTEQTLNGLHMWKELEDKFVFAKDVRQVLTYVETGNSDIGFVYESDALTSNTINILTVVDEDLHDPILYPGAVLVDSKHSEAAHNFLTFMESDVAQEILENYGFTK